MIPGATIGWRRRRRVKGGERALTRVLLALAAGEQGTARKEASRARLLLGESPQTLLLVAEAGRLAGREDEAEQAYRALAKRQDASFLGLRGLLRQAVDRRDWAEAMEIARQAEQAHPGTVWLRQQRAELALQTDNWADALELIGPDPRRTIYYVAAANAETDSARALSFARQAWKSDPTFAPATLAYARRLRQAGSEGRARSAITDAWTKAPHPELAEFLLSKETDKAARMQAAKRLVERNPSHPESRVLMARVALDSGLIAEARKQIDAARSEGVNQRRVSLLAAELEELEHGDTEAGRLAQRNALRQAATAEPDPHWQCSHCRSDQPSWNPKCGVCGSVGTLQWVNSPVAGARVPVIAG
jgi:HemY protein